jgi:hypothetical protein
MPMMVHLTPAKNVKQIVRTGIRKGERGVYCMPVLQDYLHQPGMCRPAGRAFRQRARKGLWGVAGWPVDQVGSDQGVGRPGNEMGGLCSVHQAASALRRTALA